MKTGRFRIQALLAGLVISCLCAAAPETRAASVPGFYGTITWNPNTMRSVMDPAQLKSIIQGAQNPVYSGNRVDINQTQEKAIIEWNSFNVPPGVTVNFNQSSTSWVALNRIYDPGPSYIFGTITAPGQVYLINQNGILFAQERPHGAGCEIGQQQVETVLDAVQPLDGDSARVRQPVETGQQGVAGVAEIEPARLAALCRNDADANVGIRVARFGIAFRLVPAAGAQQVHLRENGFAADIELQIGDPLG